MNTPASPLAAFCSYGNEHRRFRTDVHRIQSDVEHLLSVYGAPVEVRTKVMELLQSPETHFASGFRFESSSNYHDENRTVVYASVPIPMIDGELESALEEERNDASVSMQSDGTWRRSA